MKLLKRIIVSAALAIVPMSMIVAEGRLSNVTQAFLSNVNAGQTAVGRTARTLESAAERRGEKGKLRVNRRGSGRASNTVPVAMVDDKPTVQAFVSVDGWNAAPLAELQSMGVQVNGEYGDVLTVTAPIEKLEAIAKLGKVRQVAVAHRVNLKTDKQRSTANVNQVHSGTGLSMPYKGRDVVVGVIDAGIDFNHMAFKDEDGNTRVKRVYMPGGTGKSPVVNGKTLPGAEYTTPEEIAKLTCDLTGESHGTHTSAIAAGTIVGSYGGMAPEADIVLCGLANDLTDANIVNSINYIFSYAESVGKPAVVNLSLGDHVGPHDGTTDFCKSLDALTDAGKLLVLSAGNEGDYKLHFGTTFTNAGTSVAQNTVLLIDSDYYGGSYESAIDIYGSDASAFTFQYVVIDANGNQKAVSKKQTASANGTTFNMSTHSTFKNYYDGSGTAWFGVDANSGKYNIYIEVSAETTSSNDEDWYLGILFWGAKGQTINGWDIEGYTDFTNLGYSKFVDGDSEMSISSMATGKNTISVGAFVSRNTYPAVGGNSYTYNSLTNGTIAPFSSYGPDANGVQRPEIVGGGATVVSAVSRYDTSTTGADNYNFLAAEVEDAAGKKHYWGDMMGTSMSSPQVAGILALWLQVNPNLSVSDVREVFESTSIQDSYVTGGPAKKWGYGKIDALAGIKQVIASGVDNVKADDDNVAIYPNPCDGNFEVFAPGEQSVEVGIYSVSGMLVQQLSLPMAGGSAQVSLAGKLSPGVYLVPVEGSKLKKTTRLIVK